MLPGASSGQREIALLQASQWPTVSRVVIRFTSAADCGSGTDIAVAFVYPSSQEPLPPSAVFVVRYEAASAVSLGAPLVCVAQCTQLRCSGMSAPVPNGSRSRSLAGVNATHTPRVAALPEALPATAIIRGVFKLANPNRRRVRVDGVPPPGSRLVLEECVDVDRCSAVRRLRLGARPVQAMEASDALTMHFVNREQEGCGLARAPPPPVRLSPPRGRPGSSPQT